VKILRIRASASATAYEPSVLNIKSGVYPIARKLYIYTNGIPTGTLGVYLSFILGPTGQEILEETGYIAYTMNEK
jgi:phosphate transport system substrate-binding protein